MHDDMLNDSSEAATETDDALAFLREVVEPTVLDFLQRPDDRRRGCLACLCLASMSEHYFHARPKPVDGYMDVAAFRHALGEVNWSLRQISNVGNAIKHVQRRLGRVGYIDVSVQSITCGIARCGWPINGTHVMIEVKDGEFWLLSDLAEEALRFWRSRLEIPIRHHYEIGVE